MRRGRSGDSSLLGLGGGLGRRVQRLLESGLKEAVGMGGGCRRKQGLDLLVGVGRVLVRETCTPVGIHEGRVEGYSG